MKNYNQFLEGIRWYVNGEFLPEEEPRDGIGKYDDFITDDEFREFLIDNDCYDKYIIYFTSHNAGKNLEEVFELIDRDEYISGTDVFFWRATPEGWNYWKELSNKWKNVM